MKNYTLTQAHISSFARSLKEEEKALATIEKYLRTLQELYAWLEGREVTKEIVARLRPPSMQNFPLLTVCSAFLAGTTAR